MSESGSFPVFITQLSQTLAADPLREKTLLAPNLRLGRGWLDQAARLAGGVANCRLVTPGRLALDLADPILRPRGVRPASRQQKTRLVGMALGKLAEKNRENGYFSRLSPSLALAETLLGAIEELEKADAANPAAIVRVAAPHEKGRELAALVRNYAAGLARSRLAGARDIAAAALETLRSPAFTPFLLIVPNLVVKDLSPAETALLKAWPEKHRLLLPPASETARAERTFFTADSLADEAREVFRRLAALGLGLDQAEVVCLDAATQTPALAAAALEIFGGRLEDLPLTVSGGLPAQASRPARLLLGWLEWIANGLSPKRLADLIAAGLIGDGWRAAAPDILPHQLAGLLLELPIQGRPAEYRGSLQPAGGFDGRRGREKAFSWLGNWLERMLPLMDDRERLALEDAPRVLRAARNLLEREDPAAGKLDAYAARALLDAIDIWLPLADWPGLDAPALLEGLASGLRVMGMGPLPGRLHVSDLADGGHSGRGCTFIMGLDDSRFPGAASENAALLDRERALLSPDLRLSGHWRRRREEAFHDLLARVGGRLILSCARTDVRSGRDLFPAGVFSQLRGSYRAGEKPSGADDAVIRPDVPEKCLTRRDDWLHLLLADRQNSLVPASLAPWFPDLAQGEAALAARAANRFGIYDGLVPEAGADFFASQKPLSPSDLERLAACPLEFFFRNLLGVRPPRRFEPEPGRWLAANERGILLHDVFQRFVEETREAGTDDGSWGLLMEGILAQALELARIGHPPADDLTRRREERELAEATDIFLANEKELRQSGRPLWLELSLGESGGLPPWDQAAAIVLEAAPGLRLPFRGRIDRVDRLTAGGLRILDYKTGAGKKFSLKDPFRQGRHLQPLLYSQMLEQALADLGQPEEAAEFSYFFPMPREEGRLLRYQRRTLREPGESILASLLTLVGAGCFPFTDEAGDVKYSDYLPIYGDAEELARQAGDKMLSDPALAVWAALRKIKP